MFYNSQAAPSQLIYFHATQLAGGESGPVATQQSQPPARWAAPRCLHEGKSETLRRRGKEEQEGVFWEGEAIANQHAWQGRREKRVV